MWPEGVTNLLIEFCTGESAKETKQDFHFVGDLVTSFSPMVTSATSIWDPFAFRLLIALTEFLKYIPFDEIDGAHAQ